MQWPSAFSRVLLLPFGTKKGLHNASEWLSFRRPLPSLFRQLARPQGYDLRQSTSTELIPSGSASDPIGSALPCPAAVVDTLQATAGQLQMV